MDYRAELDKTATEGVRAPQQPCRSLILIIVTPRRAVNARYTAKGVSTFRVDA